MDGGRHVGDLEHAAAPLGDGRDAVELVVNLVEHADVAAEARLGHLAGDHEDGRRRGVRRADPGGRVEQARARDHQRGAELTGGAGVAVGHVRGRLLVPRGDELHRRLLAQRRHHAIELDARHTEHHAPALANELRHQRLATRHRCRRHGLVSPPWPRLRAPRTAPAWARSSIVAVLVAHTSVSTARVCWAPPYGAGPPRPERWPSTWNGGAVTRTRPRPGCGNRRNADRAAMRGCARHLRGREHRSAAGKARRGESGHGLIRAERRCRATRAGARAARPSARRRRPWAWRSADRSSSRRTITATKPRPQCGAPDVLRAPGDVPPRGPPPADARARAEPSPAVEQRAVG